MSQKCFSYLMTSTNFHSLQTLFKTLIMDDAWFCTYLVTKNVASLMFQGLFLHSASHGNVLGKEPVVSLLAECLYLLLADSLSNARFKILMQAVMLISFCRKSDITPTIEILALIIK